MEDERGSRKKASVLTLSGDKRHRGKVPDPTTDKGRFVRPEIEHFLELSQRAVAELDIDRLVEILFQREAVTEYLSIHRDELTFPELKACLAEERLVLQRLEEERRKLLVEMDGLSRKKKAARLYESKFPFPSMPVFFNTTG